MSMLRRVARTVGLVACTTAFGLACAQASSAYDGTWKAEFTSKTGLSREGKVVIAGATGTWDMAFQQRNNPCVGRAYPLSVTAATDAELSFKIERAATLAGCTDGKVTLRRVDDKTLEGEFEGGMKLRMIRQ